MGVENPYAVYRASTRSHTVGQLAIFEGKLQAISPTALGSFFDWVHKLLVVDIEQVTTETHHYDPNPGRPEIYSLS